MAKLVKGEGLDDDNDFKLSVISNRFLTMIIYFESKLKENAKVSYCYLYFLHTLIYLF